MIATLGFALAASLALAPVGAIAVKLPTPAQLTVAARSRDEVELERVAARLGPARLLQLAEHGKREERLAALRALPLVEGAWAMLPELARLGKDGDQDVAESAARAARRLAESLTRERMEAEEIPRDVPLRAAAELLTAGADAALRPSVRVSAIASVAALRAVCPVDEAGLVRLLADAEPQIRRAAIEAAAPGEKKLADALAQDPALDVAAAAAAALCRDLPPVAGKSPAEARAAALAAPARERVRVLALDEKQALADRIDLVNCLRVFGAPDDKKILDQLARRAPEPLKRRARSLGGR